MMFPSSASGNLKLFFKICIFGAIEHIFNTTENWRLRLLGRVVHQPKVSVFDEPL